MNKLAVSQSYLILAESMLKAQNKYIVSKIKDKVFKDIFESKMRLFIAETNICSSYEVYRGYIPRIELKFEEKVKDMNFIKKMFNKQEIEGERLAYEIVNEVIRSIDERFIEGGFKLYEALLDAEDYRVKKK